MRSRVAPEPALHEARGLARVPLHKLRGTDPNWRFAEIAAEERAHDARSTFFLMAGHGHRADGAAPEAYDRLRPQLVETLLETGSEVGLHGSYLAAEDLERLARERCSLAQLDGPLIGQRYHYLRVDPHRNLAPLAGIGFRYDTSLGFPDALGFRAGIAHPFRPWDFASDRPADLVEVPLAVMDATLAEERYAGLSAADGEAARARAPRLGGRARRRVLDPLASRAVRRTERAGLGPALLRADRGRSRAWRRSASPPGSSPGSRRNASGCPATSVA